MNFEMQGGEMSSRYCLTASWSSISLSGMSGFFKKSSDEERTHAQMLMEYQNKRGGRIVFQDIKVSLNC